MTHPNSRKNRAKEHRNLFRALWINAVLDIFYMIGGVVLATTRGSTNRLMRGSGWGIVVQGLFLFIFDTIHAMLMHTEQEDTA